MIDLVPQSVLISLLDTEHISALMNFKIVMVTLNIRLITCRIPTKCLLLVRSFTATLALSQKFTLKY